MLRAFASAFRTPDLRNKLLFTLAMLALYRLGASIPTPNTNTHAINNCVNTLANGKNGNIYSLINLFSGGALLRLSIFALGIMPYITASIIIQLLVVVIPRFEQLKKEGQSGQQKLTQYSRYLTIGLAILQSTGFIALARSGQLLQGSSPDCQTILYHQDMWTLGTMVITMTAGTGVIMWLGELITDRGVGNGMSVLMFTSIAARIPSEGHVILQNAGAFVFTLICLLGLAIIIAVVFVEQAQRRIPVQYAKRMVGRRQYGGTSTYLPLKVNQAGVIPVIFASSLLYIPQLISQLTNSSNTNTSAFYRFVTNYLINQTSWIYLSVYFVLIIFFAYFYVGITFDPVERADDMKKYGGFIPGIRPGRPTAEYLQFVLSRITLPGSIYLGIVAVLPNFFFNLTSGNNQNFPFGGTAVLIMVGVALDTVKQIESQLMQRNYEGFLR
ncbi:MAG TPA: preprotein translocase subunit SecY [Jatrophihabitans sp.]|nr:preprotein translocase subunit SecY [Jatrophihabitans sp.]